MWKRKRTLKEEYGTLGHFLRGDNECHYLGDLYIEGTNFYRHREWRGVKDTAYAFARWLQTWGKMAGLIGRDPVRMIREAEAICVGGGNTFALAKKMQEQGLMRAILRKIKAGTPYVGWSAGSNVACPTIYTTNDMPIVEPATFTAAGLVPFQINPHYTDAHPDGHAGETREQRLLEYVEANPCMTVAGLREGCILRVENGRIELIGERPMRIFRKGQAPYEVRPGDDLNFLLD